MRKTLLTLIILVIACSANAQTFRAGLAGAFNSTWLFNKNVSDAGDELDYKSTFGGQFGVSGVFIANNGPGVSLEILSSSVNQKYNNKDSILGTYVTETKLKTIAIPLLFRYTADKGVYFEVGPEFSLISGAKEVFNGTTTTIKKDNLNSLSIAAVLGFGWDIKAGDKIVISPGFRFGWGLSDVTKKQTGDTSYQPTNTAVGGLHLAVTYKLSGK